MLKQGVCFELEADPNYIGCHGGLFWRGKYVDTSKKEDAYAEYDEVVGMVSEGPLYGNALLPDFLNAFPYRCISERAFTLFQKEKLNLWGEFQWTPAHILRKSGKTIGRYWWPKFYRYLDFDVFDYEHSEYTIYPPQAFKTPPAPGVVVYDKILKLVLRGEKIVHLDFFHACNVRWFGSLRLKSLVESHHLKGFKFEPVDVWDPENLTA